MFYNESIYILWLTVTHIQISFSPYSCLWDHWANWCLVEMSRSCACVGGLSVFYGVLTVCTQKSRNTWTKLWTTTLTFFQDLFFNLYSLFSSISIHKVTILFNQISFSSDSMSIWYEWDTEYYKVALHIV